MKKIRLNGSKHHAAADGRYLPETRTHAIGIKPYSSQDTWLNEYGAQADPRGSSLDPQMLLTSVPKWVQKVCNTVVYRQLQDCRQPVFSCAP